MSRLYDNKPLSNLPVVNVQQTWDSGNLKTSGDGVIIEGTIKGRSKFCVTEKSNTRTRYYILHTKVHRAHRRKFNSSGQEVEPNFSETQKVSTGYLNSSYSGDKVGASWTDKIMDMKSTTPLDTGTADDDDEWVTPKGTSDRLSYEEVKSLICKDELTKHTNKYLPGDVGEGVSLWLPEDQVEKIEIEIDDSVRIKTEGNSPFIYSIVKMDNQSQTVSNYAGGDQVGASWTDKIMDMKSTTPLDTGTADDDDEWDD